MVTYWDAYEIRRMKIVRENGVGERETVKLIVYIIGTRNEKSIWLLTWNSHVDTATVKCESQQLLAWWNMKSNFDKRHDCAILRINNIPVYQCSMKREQVKTILMPTI